jgi:hypothetical protein
MCDTIDGMEESPKKKHAGGRPTDYQKDHTCIAVEFMAEMGLTDKQMAARLKMSESAFNVWKAEHKEFMESLTRGKAKADERVEKSLYKNAVGYVYKAQKPLVVSDGNGEGSHIEIAEYRERVAPNVSAQIFWLKNRKPKVWRDKQEVEHSGETTQTVITVDNRLDAFRGLQNKLTENLSSQPATQPATPDPDTDTDDGR